MQTPEYLKRSILAFERKPEHHYPPVEVSEQRIQHDHLCGSLVQRMPCDCDPIIEVDVRGRRSRILKDGEMTAC
jgi:hypothetical protein